jgi:hypothetical protein
VDVAEVVELAGLVELENGLTALADGVLRGSVLDRDLVVDAVGVVPCDRGADLDGKILRDESEVLDGDGVGDSRLRVRGGGLLELEQAPTPIVRARVTVVTGARRELFMVDSFGTRTI